MSAKLIFATLLPCIIGNNRPHKICLNPFSPFSFVLVVFSVKLRLRSSRTFFGCEKKNPLKNYSSGLVKSNYIDREILMWITWQTLKLYNFFFLKCSSVRFYFFFFKQLEWILSFQYLGEWPFIVLPTVSMINLASERKKKRKKERGIITLSKKPFFSLFVKQS